ncbi:hypothetical protein [Brevundimonas sp.]|uniref:hypothetical protein n=1 Tax=Brevundimonas sp. TaxID=1871086 RepID=UPI0025D4DBE9|nr:hypothetical protein [Brevundimonas sp.]
MYPNEFPPEPPPPMVDPTLLAVLLLAVAALAVIAFLLGRWTGQNRREDPDGRIEDIRKKIDDTLAKAQTATGEEVFPKARALSEAIRTGLGGVADFGGPLDRHWSHLKAALDDGEPPPAPPVESRGDTQSQTQEESAHGSTSSAVASNINLNTVVITGGVPGPTASPPPPPPPRGRRAAVSAAIDGFAEWWKAPDNRQHMQKAQADLLPK